MLESSAVMSGTLPLLASLSSRPEERVPFSKYRAFGKYGDTSTLKAWCSGIRH
jgi:hypothetical protein